MTVADLVAFLQLFPPESEARVDVRRSRPELTITVPHDAASAVRVPDDRRLQEDLVVNVDVAPRP